MYQLLQDNQSMPLKEQDKPEQPVCFRHCSLLWNHEKHNRRHTSRRLLAGKNSSTPIFLLILYNQDKMPAVNLPFSDELQKPFDILYIHIHKQALIYSITTMHEPLSF